MKKASFYLLNLFIFFYSFSLSGQIIINEVSNANGSVIFDEQGENQDWIEIYNKGSVPVSLLNYSFIDDSNKWLFPNIVIEANSFKIIFASGKDTLKGSHIHASFKLSSEGETIVLSDADGKIIDTYNLERLQNNHSIGRNPDGSQSWCLFEQASPGATNNNSICYEGYEPDPIFSLEAGFYSSGQTVEIFTPSSTRVLKYTEDGSFPSPSASPYSSAISINKTKVVSAKCFSSGNRLPSRTVKRTYFINESGCDLPVFSITLNPEDLWDYNSGIYVMGPGASSARPHYGANFWKDWEKECHVEYFDKKKVKQFELDAGLAIHGGYSRAHDQKSFRIKARSKYGTSRVEFPLISEKSFIKSYKNFNLRNGGSEYNYTRFRDAFMQRIMKNENVDRMGYEPAIVFLNGEYWGEYEIREKQDVNYLESNFGVAQDKVDLLSHKGYLRALAGTLDEFYSMHKFITSADPASSTYYNEVEQKIDLENFADYFIAQTYYSNRDWIDNTTNCNNIKLWKPHGSGKWRYMFWDLDQSSGLYGYSPTINILPIVINPGGPNVHSDILRSLLENIQYKNYFINRYADLMNTVFQYNNIKQIAYEMRDSISSSIPRHKEKWGGTVEKWQKDVEQMVNWHFQRLELQRGFIQDQFGLEAQVNLTLATSPPGAGRIKISTIIPDSLPWKGVYYNGVPVTITAIPNPGFTFESWGVNGNISSPDPNESITLNISTDDTFTAFFTGSVVTPQLLFSEINYHSDPLKDAGDWFELFNYGNIPLNLSGWMIKDGMDSNEFEIPMGTVIPPKGYIVFSCDTQKFISQHPFVTNLIGQLPFKLKNNSDNIRLFKHDKSLGVSVTYRNNAPWPREADGFGKTLELKDPQVSLDLGTNWFAGCVGGSPGIAYNMKCLTGVEELSFNSIQFLVTPNPSSGPIEVEIVSNNTDPIDISLELYDFMGVMVKQTYFSNNKKLIVSRDGLAPGIYILKIRDESSTYATQKLILQ